MGALGQIFCAHGKEYRARFADRMSTDQLRAMRSIEACHTPAAGTALWRCPGCGQRHFTFVGCGNRHCPACGGTRAAAWLRKHSALLLPGVVYHLVGFTVPEGLRRTLRSQPRELLDVLMRVSASTLLDVCANEKWLGAIPGLTAVLHTWTRQLEYHPHVHFIATGGGVNGAGQWINAHDRFLVPVAALSIVFRARFRDTLRAQYPHLFARVKPDVWQQHNWVVHSKPVGSGPLYPWQPNHSSYRHCAPSNGTMTSVWAPRNTAHLSGTTRTSVHFSRSPRPPTGEKHIPAPPRSLVQQKAFTPGFAGVKASYCSASRSCSSSA